MSNSKNKNLTIFRRYLDKLWSQVGYFDGEFYAIEKSGDNYLLKPASADFKAKVVILAMPYYQEQSLSFPVVDQKELKKILNLQGKKGQYNLVQKQEDNKTIINRWFFLKHFDDAILVLPESLLLSKGLTSSELLLHNVDPQPPRVYANVGGVIHSAQLQGVLNSQERFASSIGVSRYTTKKLNQNQLAQSFVNGIKALKMKEVLALLKHKKESHWQRKLQFLLFPAFIVVSVYLAASSAWLLAHGKYIEWEYSKLENRLGNLMDTQDTLTLERQTAKELIAIINQQPSYVGLISSLVPLLESARITNIRYENGRYIVRGITDKASELLQRLASQDNVDNAKFDLPVTKNGSKERFTISLALTAKLTIPSGSENVDGQEVGHE